MDEPAARTVGVRIRVRERLETRCSLLSAICHLSRSDGVEQWPPPAKGSFQLIFAAAASFPWENSDPEARLGMGVPASHRLEDCICKGVKMRSFTKAA